MRMKHGSWVVVVVAMVVGSLHGCGGDSSLDPNARVADLSDEDAVTLCEEFRTAMCASPEIAAEWNFGCSRCTSFCSDSQAAALMRSECATPIEVADVNACMAAADDGAEAAMQTCVETMGGCVFDVADEICGVGL